jgi:hypothetical protein
MRWPVIHAAALGQQAGGGAADIVRQAGAAQRRLRCDPAVQGRRRAPCRR